MVVSLYWPKGKLPPTKFKSLLGTQCSVVQKTWIALLVTILAVFPNFPFRHRPTPNSTFDLHRINTNATDF